MKFCYLMEENGVGVNCVGGAAAGGVTAVCTGGTFWPAVGVGALGGAVWGAGSYSVGQLWKGLFG